MKIINEEQEYLFKFKNGDSVKLIGTNVKEAFLKKYQDACFFAIEYYEVNGNKFGFDGKPYDS